MWRWEQEAKDMHFAAERDAEDTAEFKKVNAACTICSGADEIRKNEKWKESFGKV